MIDTANVDADIVVYSCGFAAQETSYMTADGVFHATVTEAKKHIKDQKLSDTEIEAFTEAEPLSHALHLVNELLSRVSTRTACKEMRLFLTGKDNFREEIAVTRPYKGNRVAAKPLHYDKIKEYLIDKWGAVVIDGMEADDALGILQTPEACIATIDKDLNMVEGYHYNWRKDELYEVQPDEAIYNFYYQLLVGDPTDNIPGVPGIGKVKAEKHLAECEDEEDMYWKALALYAEAYSKPYEVLLEQANLLWILREEDQRWQTKY